jgi:hypothetical protein
MVGLLRLRKLGHPIFEFFAPKRKKAFLTSLFSLPILTVDISFIFFKIEGAETTL